MKLRVVNNDQFNGFEVGSCHQSHPKAMPRGAQHGATAQARLCATVAISRLLEWSGQVPVSVETEHRLE